ncbi:MAG: FadR/GntR family transcriptional regulator [Pseudomonadota bacterium]
MTSFQPVRQTRISEKVLTQLKQAILSGTYLPGEKLPSERELCLQFEASRVVIREAIRALELTGFVTLRQGPSGGAFVQELTLTYLSNAFRDLFLANKLSAQGLVEARLHIEPEVCRLAALTRDTEAGGRLETAFKQEHARNMTHTTWVSRNLKIHYLLARMCGNPFFEAILTPLLDLTRELVLVVKPSQKVIHEHDDHQRIIDAVISGDPVQASKAMHDHIAKVGNALIDLEQVYRARKKL